MATLTVLPEVATRTYVDCKKCGCERFHVVLAHSSATACKIECEVCHAKRTMKLETTKKKKPAAKGKKTRVTVGSRWEQVQSHIKQSEKQPYSMKTTFALHTTIDHPKFGIGVVMSTLPQSMEVVFEDGTRSLVHNRT